MLKLTTLTREELKNKISKDDFLDSIIEEVNSNDARVLESETATGVIKIFKDSKEKLELFVSALQGAGGRKYMAELLEFAKANKLNYVGLQTKRQGMLKVLINRFDFRYLGNNDGYFKLRKEIL